jgi:hypothetical protein
MQVFSYRSGTPNAASITKGGLDLYAFQIDWTQGMPSGATLSTTTITAVDSANQSTTNVVNTSTNSGSVTTVFLKTGGASGTGAATDGARFRIRVLQLLSSTNGTLLFDVFLLIVNPTYAPLEHETV